MEACLVEAVNEICLRVLSPPLIPDFDSLFKLREVFGVRRGASK